jgi:hypothetical protein
VLLRRVNVLAGTIAGDDRYERCTPIVIDPM